MLAIAALVILIAAGLAAAQDEGLPVVVCPEDIPGADVILFLGEDYKFDVSESYDGDGIAYFEIAFLDGGVEKLLTTSTGIVTYRFQSYGQTWVSVTAYDIWGNAGVGRFSIDVAERITGAVVIQDTSAYIDHSLYLDGGDLTVDNSHLTFADGAGKGAGADAGKGVVPEMLSESLTPDGDLAGHWEPYYWYWGLNQGDDYYGYTEEDYDTKLVGDMSIRLSGGYYYYGIEYHFDENADLSMYNGLSFWMHSGYQSYYNMMYYVYFYGDHDYSGSNGYGMTYAGALYQGGYSWYNGWHGYTIPIDMNNIGYGYWYNFGSGLTSVACIQIYMWGVDARYGVWIDGVGFHEGDWGDEITESATPSGELGGYWKGGTTSSLRYTGDYSVQFTMDSTRTDVYYYFNRPTDLSMYSALRYFLKMTAGGADVYYSYYWGYSTGYNLYIYDTRGNYCAYYVYPYTYTFYGYQKWYSHSLPWGTEAAYTDTGVDMTKVDHFVINDMYMNYIYPSGSPMYLYIDGLEWVRPGGSAGSMQTDSVPITIYVEGGDTTFMRGSSVTGSPISGARIRTRGGSATFQESTFDSLWGTQFPGVHNAYGIMGGLEVLGDATVKDVYFTNCRGPGLALFDGTMNLDMDTIHLEGTGTKIKGSPQLILGATSRTTVAKTIDVTKWDLSGNTKGSGIMVMLDECDVRVDVLVHRNTISSNKFDGVILSNWGGTGDVHFKVYDQVIEDNGNNGLVFWAGRGEWSPGTTATFEMTNVTIEDCGSNGVQIILAAGALDIDIDIHDCWIEGNEDSGISNVWEGVFGKVVYTVHNVTITDNDGSGIDTLAYMEPYVDADGNHISPVSDIKMALDSVSIQANGGMAIFEDLNAVESPDGGSAPPWTWDGPTRTTLIVNVTITESFIGENSDTAWYVTSSMGWVESNLLAERNVIDSSFEDNRGAAVHIEVFCDVLQGDAEVSDIWWFERTQFSDNLAGFVHDLGTDNPGYYAEVHLRECTIRNTEREAILVQGGIGSDGMREYGVSNVLGVEYFVESCWINGPVRTYLMGANDYGRDEWQATMGLMFWNNTYDNEAGIEVRLGATQRCEDVVIWCDIGQTRYLKKLAGDGLRLEVYGGQNLDLELLVRDQSFIRPPGSGLDVKIGLLWPGPEPHKISGPISINNVTVQNAGSNGINLTYDIAQVIGSNIRAFLDATGLSVDGAAIGIYATGIDGKVYLSSIRNCRFESVFVYDALFDFFGCDIGPITVDNVNVFTKGAARIWYDMGIDVKWASGARVVGAVVSVEDNTYSTLGVSTMGADSAIPFGYVNSYTILPDSVYSKSPFMMRATYLGLVTEKMEDVNRNAIIDLIMVDDVEPRLTVTTPVNGAAQTANTITVKGFAWDLHSGLNVVEASLDGQEWLGATRMQEFTIMVDVPEGEYELMIRALDQAGNSVVEHVKLTVDATPPLIQIVEPKLDVFSTRTPTLRVTGVTEAGATVTIAGARVAMDLTLFRTDVKLNEGPNEVTVIASDSLGNTAVHVIRVTLDTIPPPLLVIEPKVGTTIGKAQVTVVGQTEPGAMVRINGAPVANLMGTFTGRPTLGEGPNTIIVEAEDSIGNKRTVRVPVIVDTVAPWMQVDSPTMGGVYGTKGIPVEGWVEAGTSVFVNDAKVDVESGRFSTLITGSEGMFTVSVLAVDEAGNEVSKTITVIVDLTAPVIVLEEPTDGALTKDDHIMLEGRLLWNRETFREIRFLVNGVFTPFASDGAFRERIPIGEGVNTLQLEVSDNLDNTHTVHVTVVRDTVVPFLLVDAQPTFIHAVWNKPVTYNQIVYLEGDTEPGATVTVDGEEIEVGTDGHFRVSVSLADIPAGQDLSQTTVTVIAKDDAGNFKQETLQIYRLRESEEDKGLAKYEAAQWWALLLSVVVLVLALLTVWLLLRYAGRQRSRGE